MCIVMMLSMIMTNVNAEETSTMKAEAFHIEVNSKALARTLDAEGDQVEAINDVMTVFEMQTKCISTETNDRVRRTMMKNAVNDNVRLMRGVLNNDQMKTYLKVLNVTLQNRGVMK